MKRIFNNLFKDSTEEYFIDGTFISKYSEKVLNDTAKLVYYAFLGFAILIVMVGLYVFLKCIYDAIQLSSYDGGGSYAAQTFGYGLLGLIAALFFAVINYGFGVLISSALRVITNISLSLKRLNYNKVGIQQPMRQQMPNHAPQKTNQASTTTCPECANIIPAGSKTCPECGYPLD